MSNPQISAIVCTHNREQYLGAAIDSLLAQEFAGDFEVIVVDNASSDRTREVVGERLSEKTPDERLRYVYEATIGLSTARNTGARAAQSSILAYLDDDAIASPQWLQVLYDAYQQDEKLAIAGGKVTLLWAEGTQSPHWLSPGLASNLGAYDLGNQKIYITQPGLTPRGLNYSIRRSFLEQVDGFDRHLGRVGKNLLSNEELHMTELALAQGWQVAYLPEAHVAHNVAPERLHPQWFLDRGWWQGISESYREQLTHPIGILQLSHGSEKLLRGLWRSLKHWYDPAQRFDNFAYAYGQVGYLKATLQGILNPKSKIQNLKSKIPQPMSKLPISVLIPAKNEEANLPACLASLTPADEVFVVDSQSSDRSIEIAESYGAKVVQFCFNGRWPKKKNWSLENLPFQNEWVLIVDCDERITPELWEEIAIAIQNPAHAGYYLNRRVFFLGQWIRFGGKYPDWNLRLFRHAQGRYENLHTEEIRNTGDNEVHEHVMVSGKVGYLKSDMLHIDFRNLYHWIERHNRYSNWEAQVYYNLLSGDSLTGENETIGANFFGDSVQCKRFLKKIWVRLPFKPFLRFAITYILRLGFLDGRAGYIYARLLSQYEYQIGVKLHELRFGGSLNKPSMPGMTDLSIPLTPHLPISPHGQT